MRHGDVDSVELTTAQLSKGGSYTFFIDRTSLVRAFEPSCCECRSEDCGRQRVRNRITKEREPHLGEDASLPRPFDVGEMFVVGLGEGMAALWGREDVEKELARRRVCGRFER